jgi:hypothetical protein
MHSMHMIRDYLEHGESYAHEALMGSIPGPESLHQRYNAHLVIYTLLSNQKLYVVSQKLRLNTMSSDIS